MRHRKGGFKLGRNASHRLALYRNLTMALVRHERIITTVPKAKARGGVAFEGLDGKLKYAVAGVVRYRFEHGTGADARITEQQFQLLHFLHGCQQVAFHPVAQKLQGIVVDAQSRGRNPLAQPSWQVAVIHRPYLDNRAGLVQCLEPLTVCGLLVDPAGHHHQHGITDGDAKVVSQVLVANRP